MILAALQSCSQIFAPSAIAFLKGRVVEWAGGQGAGGQLLPRRFPMTLPLEEPCLRAIP